MTAHNLIIPYISCGDISVIKTLFFSEYFAIVNFKSPRDALRLIVTGISVEYAKPPANPIKWREFKSIQGITGHLLSRSVKTEVRHTCMQVYSSDDKLQWEMNYEISNAGLV